MEIEERLSLLIENDELDSAKKILLKLKKGFIYFFYYAEILRISGFIKKAIFFYKKALKYTKEKDKRFEIFIKIASIYRTIGNIRNAKYYLDLASKIGLKSDDLDIEKAMFLRLCGKFDKALKILTKLEKKFIKEKDYDGVSYILWAKGGTYRSMGRLKKSEQSFYEAIRYANKSRNKTLKVYSMLGLSGTLRISGEIRKSFKLYKKCISLAPKNDLFAKGYALCGTGNALRQLGDYNLALRYYKIALKHYAKIKDFADLALVLWGMSECYKKKDINTALMIAKKALNYLKNLSEPRGLILIYMTLGHIYYIKGQINKAKKYFDLAIKISKKHNLNVYLECFG